MDSDQSQAKELADRLKCCAVPIGNDLQGNYGVGTAFLGRRDGRVSLYTAAHNLQATLVAGKLLPIDDWAWLASTIDVPLGRLKRKVEVFTIEQPSSEGTTNGRAPTFRWLEKTQGHIIDAVKFDLTATSPVLQACLEDFAIVDLDDVVSANKLGRTDRLIWVGFPGHASDVVDGQAPHGAPDICTASFVAIRDDHIHADRKADLGFSGGPVFTEDGQLAGMVAGTEFGVNMPYGHARIITAHNLMSL